MKTVCSFIILLLICCMLPLQCAQAYTPGRQVRTISFLTWVNLSYEDLIVNLPLQPGQVFSQEKLEQSVQMLYEREVFDYISARATETELGMEIEFVLTPRLTISEVLFEGRDTLNEDQLRRAAGLRPGQVFDIEALSDARTRLLKLYLEYGHHEAEIKMHLEESPVGPYVKIVVGIVENNRSTISKITIDGELPEDVAFVRKRLDDYGLNLPASQVSVKRLKAELLTALRQEGYLQASVSIGAVEYQQLTGDTEVTYKVTTREPLTLNFVGNNVFSAAELLAPLKLERRRVPFSPTAIRTLVKEIRALYQQNGFYFASVSSAELPSDGTRKVYRITIEEGKQYRIGDIEITGNDAISNRELEDQLVTEEAGIAFLKRLWPGFLIDDDLATDKATLEQYYADRGYFGTEVTTEVTVDEEDAEVDVHFKVAETPQRRIRHVFLRWKGIAEVLRQEGSAKIATVEPLNIATELQVGEAFTEQAIQKERERLFRSLHRSGYANSTVEIEEDNDLGTVTYILEPGPQIRIGRIVLQGNVETHDGVIEQELKTVAGDFWRVYEVRASQRSLYGLGFFSSVQLEPLDGALDEEVEDLRVRVSERETGTFDVGAGLSSEEGIHLNGEIAQRNLFGNGAAIILGVDGYFRTGQRLLDAGRARLAYARPHVFGSGLDLSLEAFLESQVTLIDQFSYDREGLAALLRVPLLEHVKGTFGLKGFQERLFDVREDVVIDEHDVGTTFYSLGFGSLDLDRRDDPYNPRSGYRTELEGRVANDALGSEINYLAASLQQSLFTPLSNRLVWANRVALSGLMPYGDTDVIPLGQRLFLGGRNSLRGFSLYSIGPRGADSNVLGGDTSLNLSTEFRYDLTESVVGIMFLDAGQAFLEHPGTFEGDPLSAADLRFSPGFGVHYKTPIGPISAEVGFALDREFGERFGRFNFGVGSAF